MSDLARNVLAAVVVLAVATGLGVLATMEDPSTGEQIISVLRDTILGESEVVSGPLLAVTLFCNNLQACLLMFLGGASLGILTAFIITVNGFVIGSVLELVRQQHSLLLW